MFRQRQSLSVARRVVLLVTGAIALPALAHGQEQSVYDRLGGLAPISVVVSDFVDALCTGPGLLDKWAA